MYKDVSRSGISICPFLSVIIPVYNAAEFIKGTLNSLSNLLEAENMGTPIEEATEIIIVDDGSSDGTSEILDQWKIDHFITHNDQHIFLNVIHQKNRGVSCARNAGLSSAKGKYITFLDADDRFILKNIRRLSGMLNDGKDLYIFQYFKSCGRNTKLMIPEGIDQCVSFVDLLNLAVSKRELNNCWGKVYKAEVLKNHQVFFPKDVKVGEDLLFVLRAISASKSFEYIALPIYRYEVREDSVMTSFHISRFDDLHLVYKETLKYVDKKIASEACLIDFCSTIAQAVKTIPNKEILYKISNKEYIEFLHSVSAKACGNRLNIKFTRALLKTRKIRAVVLQYQIRRICISLAKKLKLIKNNQVTGNG